MKSLINIPTLLGILSSNKYSSVTSQAIFSKRFDNVCKIVCQTIIKDIDFGMGTSNMTCSCSSSRFLYTPANHVITGNLDIVKNTELHNLINKGPSFREQNNINKILRSASEIFEVSIGKNLRSASEKSEVSIGKN